MRPPGYAGAPLPAPRPSCGPRAGVRLLPGAPPATPRQIARARGSPRAPRERHGAPRAPAAAAAETSFSAHTLKSGYQAPVHKTFRDFNCESGAKL
eukprot:5912729-Prymnesium_polylepis.1